jgi:hypothetical protein
MSCLSDCKVAPSAYEQMGWNRLFIAQKYGPRIGVTMLRSVRKAGD